VLIVSAALGVASALALVACGDDDEIENKLKRSDARSLLAELEQVRESFAAGDCTSAEVDAQALASEVEDLPQSVDEELRRGLNNGANNLVTLVARDCEAPTEPTTTEEEPTTTEEEEPTTTEEEPTTTEEEPTDETTTEDTTTTTEPPPSGGGGIGPPGGGAGQ
jgi:outer membrane biosynthesis protein TonB